MKTDASLHQTGPCNQEIQVPAKGVMPAQAEALGVWTCTVDLKAELGHWGEGSVGKVLTSKEVEP